MEWGHFYERGWGFFAHILTQRFCIRLIWDDSCFKDWWRRGMACRYGGDGLMDDVEVFVGPLHLAMFRRDS